MASSSTSSEATSNWRESDKRYFPLVYHTEPKKFPRHKYPEELKDKKVYALYARTRPQRAPGHDQELLIQPDNDCCGACPDCQQHQHCKHQHPEDCLLQHSGPCTKPDVDLDTYEFRWLPKKVNDRLTVLSIHDAKAYDAHIMENASHKDTRKFVIKREIADVRIWPNLHQYGHNYTFTNSNIATGMQYKGIGNNDGFGIFCCEDCYKGAEEEERILIKAGDNDILENDGWYERLFDYNDKLKECIAMRKEKEACATEYIFEKHLYWENQAGRPTTAAPSPTPRIRSVIFTFKYQVTEGMEWERGWGCSECPNVYCDRLRGEGAAYKKSLQCHVDEQHPGHSLDELAYRRGDKKLRKARSTKKRGRDDTGGDDSAAPPAKRRKSQASAPGSPRVVVQKDTSSTPPYRQEVLSVIHFDDWENYFLALGTYDPRMVRLGRKRFGLIHHAGSPAIRGAAFRSLKRRSWVGESATR